MPIVLSSYAASIVWSGGVEQDDTRVADDAGIKNLIPETIWSLRVLRGGESTQY
jgi:hypothetical protein